VRILLTGKNGQVGFELSHALAREYELVSTARHELDLADAHAIRRWVREIKPDLVINAAAYTAVDRAEDEPELAFSINHAAPAVLAEASRDIGALLIHYSTDYVFDGTKSEPYVETDAPHPLGIYGRSKLEGERAITQSGAKHWIIRTSWVYGVQGSNFPKTILRLAKERDSLKVVADQFGAPTSAALIAEVTARMVQRLTLQEMPPLPSGCFHLTAGGATSWFEYARYLLNAAARAGIRTRLSPECIEPVTSEAYGAKAPRPRNSQLNTRRIEQTFGISLPPWQDGVDDFLKHLDKGSRDA
jgi:dTDP-4-dehydrorhamnose reductase